MGIREDLTSTLGVAGGAAFGGLTWFLNSPLLGVVSGVLLGTSLTLLTQSRFQKRIWRRELALKNIETIYAPLYKELEMMLEKTHSFDSRASYDSIEETQWNRIIRDYVYHFIPPDLANEIANLYAKVRKYNSSIGPAYTKAENLLMKELADFYTRDIQDARYAMSWSQGTTPGIALFIPALFARDPREMLRAANPHAKDPSFYVWYAPRVSQGSLGNVEIRDPAKIEEFDRVFLDATKKIQSSPEVTSLRSAIKEINSLAPKVRDSLLRLIKAPWST